MASVEKRPNASGVSWRVVWWQDGKRESETLPTQADARKFKAHVEAAGNRWPAGWIPRRGWDAEPVVRPTVAQWSERWLAALSGVTERTRADYERQLGQHVLPTLGDIPVDMVTREQVRAWVNGLGGLAPKTVHNLHGLLAGLMGDAAADGLRTGNPCDSTRLPREDHDKAEMVFLTPQEAATLVEHADPQVKDLITLLLGTGLRWGEVSALQVGDVDPFAATLSVKRAWQRTGTNTFELGPPKTQRSRRTIGLSPTLVDVLLPHLAGRDGSEFVFVTAFGNWWRHANFRYRFWVKVLDAANAAGMPKRPRIHDLRHTHASWLIAAGVPLPMIQRRLGHESITTSIDRYGHLLPSLEDDVSAAIEAALASGSGMSGATLAADPVGVDPDIRR